MFERIAELAIRRSRLVLVVAVVAVALMGVLGAESAFAKLLGGGYDDPASQSSRAAKVIDREFGGETNLVLLVSASDGRVDAPAARQSGEDLVAHLKKDQNLENVISYWDTGSSQLRSTDGRDAMVLAHVKGNDTERDENTKSVIDAYTGTYEKTLTVRVGGGAAVTSGMGTQSAKDLVLAESIAIPLTLVLLLLVFGSMIAALLPLAIGTIAIAGTFAELYLLGSVTDVSVFAINLTTALGLGLGIDYALLMVSRFREQLATGASVDDAVRRTVSTAGRTVAFSAATVAAALAALLVFPQYFLRSFGYAGVGVVVIAAVSTLFVILGPVRRPRPPRQRRPPALGEARTLRHPPALLGTPGRHRHATPRAHRTARPRGPAGRGVPAPRHHLRHPDERVLPENAASRQVSSILREKFHGNDDSAVHIVIDTAVSKTPLKSYATELAPASRASSASRPAREPTATDSPRRPAPAPPPSAAPTPSRSTW